MNFHCKAKIINLLKILKNRLKVLILIIRIKIIWLKKKSKLSKNQFRKIKLPKLKN